MPFDGKIVDCFECKLKLLFSLKFLPEMSKYGNAENQQSDFPAFTSRIS